MPEMCKKFYSRRGYGVIRKRKLTSRKFEIPIFDNTFLDYKLSGEFKKYIHFVKIEEHEFEYEWKRNGKKGKKVEMQTDYWKATFEFDKIPKKGLMEIKFL